MSSEREIIELITTIMPKSEARLNKPFESDSEVLDYHGRKLLVTVDEFSKEDLFRTDDPYILGWNIAVGGISDILASGGRPLFYAHSLVIDDMWDEEYIRKFSEGAAEALRKSGTAFIGGDFGRAKDWRCAVTVIGDVEGDALFRSGAAEGDSIYITGEVGKGNLEAFLSLYSDKMFIGSVAKPVKNRFNLRFREAELIKKYASSCIDTSDGVFNSLNAISNSSGTGYIVKDLPYMKLGRVAAKLMSMPKSLLFLGECGEYELLFTIKGNNEEELVKEAEKGQLNLFKIGIVADSSLRELIENSKKIDLSGLEIGARGYTDRKAYIRKLIEFLEERSR